MTKVLVVDDEASISGAVSYALRREGYTVETAADGEEALGRVDSFRPEVMVLDVMMPKLSGYEVCRRLEVRPQRPAILLLTVKNDIVDKVLGLELGADDYMTKPFDMRELVARVKALSRRGLRTSPEITGEEREPVRLGGLTINLLNRTVHAGDAWIDLTPKEFDLLALLAEHPGRVYSREALLEQVWDMDFAGGTRTVDMHVQRLRKKLGQWSDVIQTVYGIGYKGAEQQP
ncbi:MAG: response regulator transcription factor [Paenibacillaceae bacterium]|uniref:Response regulator transcription factor n=1 Tax=Paenibacillus mellifer TaxID=2937794 RepID=A0A9X2BQC3_9BACL|nr:response regulator transcription factor [Paenibacillus mellifer]MBW4840818.1 response regulator transcription factor [Paenibacillaceae bacterium]MCK8487697.1 response regulator transcription factor [Paenibacillus mellifer]